MATKNYTTSVTVNFSTSSDDADILKAEVDGREDGLNGGLSNFIPGVDAPYILVFKSSPVTIDSVDQSAGSMIDRGVNAGESFLVEDYITLADERESTLSYPVSSGWTAKWVGRAGGTISHTETTVYVPENTVGVIKVSYTANYRAYQLTGIPSTLSGETEFPVVVYITGSA